MYTYNLVSQLARRGMRVTVATHTQGVIPAAYQNPSVSVVHIPKIRKGDLHRLPGLLAAMSRLIGEHDLAWANYTYALSSLTVLLGRAHGKRPLVFAHGLGTIIDVGHPSIYHLYRAITLISAHRVITTSEEIASIARRFSRSVRVMTAVDFSHIDSLLDARARQKLRAQHEGRKVLLTVRRLVDKNGIQYLIEALPYLRSNYVYLVAGDGRLRPQLEARVQELGLEKRVVFLGEVENNHVFNLIYAADTVAFPSSAEALSLAAIECMYLGTPIVATAIGGLRELVGEHEERGTLVDLFGRPESVYQGPVPSEISKDKYLAFARALDAALERGSSVLDKAAQARSYVKDRYDWAKVADEILEFATG